MHHFSHTELANTAWSLYQTALNEAAAVSASYPRARHTFSAQNLKAYLAYKNNVHAEFTAALRHKGLCISSNQHMIQSLHTLCSNLGILLPRYPAYREAPLQLAKKRKEIVLGKKHRTESPHIMVTLDTQMTASVIERFLLNGMSIARINCAYGEAAAWEKLIRAIRGAEDRLRRKGLYEGERCQIYMDLAGPKIRIGPLKKVAYPLKIGIKKNQYGQPLRAKKGFISWNPTAGSHLMNEEHDFIIYASSHQEWHSFQQGEPLYFIDSRHKKRQFLITDVSSAGLAVTLEETAYINEQTTFKSADGQVELLVRHLETSPVQIEVKKGDFVRLYLRDDIEGHPATESTTAGIPVTLPEAFATIQQGDRVLIDDGKIQAAVRKRNNEFIDIEILFPDTQASLKENKGINLPDCQMNENVAALTQKDKQDLVFICEHADMVGISFVHSPGDLRQLQQLMHSFSEKDLAVIAKIETREAVRNFSNILLEGLTFSKFGVMVARGDLAIEIGFEQLPVVQKEILTLCRAAHVPVILATQVLESLAKKGTPSRSELADLSFGSEFDGIMLNKGPFMEETIEFLTDSLSLLSQVKDGKQMITRSPPFKIPTD